MSRRVEQRSRGWLARGSITVLIMLQLLLVVTVVSSVLFLSNELRKKALQNMEVHLRVQAQNLEERLTQSFDLLRMHINALVIEHPNVEEDPKHLKNVLLGLQQKLPYVRSLSLLDQQNSIILSTQKSNEGLHVPLSGLLPKVADDTPNLLRFGYPWAGRDFFQAKPLYLAQYTSAKPMDLSFFPVVMVLPELSKWRFLIAISGDYFVNLFAHQNAYEHIAYRMYTDDGVLLFSTADNENPGEYIVQPTGLEDMLFLHQGSGHWEDAQGHSQLMAYRASSKYPWSVQSYTCCEHVLQDWSKSAKNLWLITVSILVCVLLVTSFLTYRVRRSLRQEEEFLEENRQAAIVFSYSSDLIVILDNDGRVLTVNPAFEKHTGFKESELLGRTFQDYVPNYQPLVEKVLTTGSWEGEVSWPHKKGQLITGWLVVNAIKNKKGQMSHFVAVFRDLSQLIENETTIRKLSQAVEQSPSSILITSLEPAIEYANPEFYRATGYSKQEVVGANPNILQSGLTPKKTYQSLWEKLSQGQVWQGEFINRRKNGSIFYERSIVSPLFDEEGQVTGYLGIKHDVTAEIQAKQTMQLAVSVIQNTLEGVLICNAQGKIIEVNPAFSQITGFSREAVLYQSPSILGSSQQNKAARAAMFQALNETGHWRGEFWNRHKQGHAYVIDSSVSVIKNEHGAITHYISVFSDITRLKQQQQSLEQQAYFDLLTGLPNRALFNERLKQAVASADSERHWVGICFIDLDHFKAVNDTYGHDAGDDLLMIVGQRIQHAVRTNDLVARLGGDEFVVLLNPLSSVDESIAIVKRVLAKIREPIIVAGHQVQVTGSIGVTIYPLDNSDTAALIRHADAAMYQAKEQGRDRLVLAAEIDKAGGGGYSQC